VTSALLMTTGVSVTLTAEGINRLFFCLYVRLLTISLQTPAEVVMVINMNRRYQCMTVECMFDSSVYQSV